MPTLDMRALYYIELTTPEELHQGNSYERVKANENCLNQNFTALEQLMEALDQRIAALEASETLTAAAQ